MLNAVIMCLFSFPTKKDRTVLTYLAENLLGSAPCELSTLFVVIDFTYKASYYLEVYAD